MNGYFVVQLTKQDSKLVSTKATFPIVVSITLHLHINLQKNLQQIQKISRS